MTADKDVKAITKAVQKAVTIAKFTKENWYILALFGGIIWGIAKMYYKTLVEPEVRSYVTTIVYEMGKDSIPKMIHIELDTLLKKRGVSFRTGIIQETGINKDSVVSEYAKMYTAYLGMAQQKDSLKKFVNYTNGVFLLIVKEYFTAYPAQNGAKIYYAPSGDAYYFDVFGLLWSANLSNADGCYYYYPPYNNNERTKCT